MGGTAQYEYETVLDQIVNKRFDVCSLIGEVNHMRNIIFLDIDGVLNSNFWNKSHQREISDMKPLRVEAQNLSELLAKEGLKIADVTPDLTTEEIRRTRKFSLIKAEEILLWVASHENINSWVVLEDLDLHKAIIEEHQVKIDQMTGLTPENVQEAERILSFFHKKS